MYTDRGGSADELDPPTCESASGGGLLVDDAFVRRHAPFVRRSLTRLGVVGSELDDGIQDVFLAAVRGAERFDVGRSERGWLYGIAVNIAREQRKKRWRRERAFGEPAEASVPAPQEREVERAEARSLIHRALDELPAEQRDVIVLYRLEGWPMGDVAEALGCALDTAHSRLRLGTHRLGRFVRRSFVRGRCAALLAALASALGMPPTAAAATVSAVAVALVLVTVAATSHAPGEPPATRPDRVATRGAQPLAGPVSAAVRAPAEPGTAPHGSSAAPSAGVVEPSPAERPAVRARAERPQERATTVTPTVPEPTPVTPGQATHDSAPAALLEETQLLARARALAGASPDEARQLLDAYDARFPRGQLRRERNVIAAQLSARPAP
ncbi:MAG: sigma-70 family RNA polymerase sigma factor [Sandaracinaceae bacterium]|nr:sigma-70 family RNA polymerase sigma factor [Sandaracinaceae bacterium]